MSARPGQPVDESGRPITLGVATYTETPDALPMKSGDDVEGHIANAIPTDDEEPGPKLAT